MQQQNRQQAEQYHRQQVEELLGDLRTQQQAQLDERQRQSIRSINEAGQRLAQTIVDNTQAGTEQEEAVKRTVEACQWSAVSVLHQQQNR